VLIATVGHMAQLGKKNLNLFQALQKEKVSKAKNVGNTKLPNFKISLWRCMSTEVLRGK